MDFKDRARELVSQMTLAEKMSQMKYDSPAIDRFGIPAYNWWNECLHGVARSGAATVFPQAIGMAAAFDPPLVEKVGEAVSDEARAKYNEYRKFGSTGIYQGLTYWSPNINIFRDPRWGRGHETYGEDPFLTSVTGVAYVRGLQGHDPKYRKLDATVKHFAVHSGPESLRHGFNVEVSKKDLWETYLRAFKYCIDKADVSAVMGAYNRVDGEPCCGSPTLLEKILRGKMKFGGYVVSDCGAINDINDFHHLTKNQAESAALAVNAGCDLNCGGAYSMLKVAYGEGLVSEEKITRSVERLIAARLRLGLLSDDCPYDAIPYETVESDANTGLNLKIARESIVLLKNDGLLPLSKSAKLAVIGPNADDKLVLLGNYNGTPSKYFTLLRGIQDAVGSDGRIIYARGCHIFKDHLGGWEEAPENEAIIAAKNSDVVIMIMGLNPTMEGEEGDAFNGQRGGDRADIELPDSQKKLYEVVRKVEKPIIFVNVSGSCVNLGAQNDGCGAVIQCFYPGALGGKALADVIFGDVSPSGRLPVTFYRSTDDLPDFEDYSMKNRTYRYFDGEALYPFGYGLSYADFEYSDSAAAFVNGGLSFSVTLENAGKVGASEAVTVYLLPKPFEPGQPRTKLVFVEKFFLAAGEKIKIERRIDSEDLMYTDENGELFTRRGDYTLAFGGCAPEYAKLTADLTL